MGYQVRTTTIVTRDFKVNSSILPDFKLHIKWWGRRVGMFTRREYHAWGIHGPSIAISNQAYCRRNMTVPGDQPRHLQNYPISTNSNNSTTPLSSKISCTNGNFRWGNNQSIFFWRELVIITVTPLSGAASSNDKIHNKTSIEKEQGDRQL